MSTTCPICDGEFIPREVRAITVSVCSECSGLWLTAGDFERLAGEDVANDLEEWTEEPTECRHCRWPLGFSRECGSCGELAVVHCPLGHGKMNAALVEIGGAEFEIDRCPSCRGVWIDSHEREHVEGGAPVQSTPKLRAPSTAMTSYRTSRTARLADRLERQSMNVVHTSFFAPEPHRWGKKEPGALIIFGLFILALGSGIFWLLGGSLSLM